MWLERATVRDFRNLEALDFRPCRGINVIAGDNGQGKTSLLEAVYFAATSKSFRTSRSRELVSHGRESATVKARFVEARGEMAPLAREQVASVHKSTVQVRVDDNKPDSLASYATLSPVVVFHPDDLVLSTGPAAGRRRLLDRVGVYLDPTSLAQGSRYARALKARQELLRRGAGDIEVDAYEAVCAESGAALGRARQRAAADVARDLVEAFSRIGSPSLALTARYAPGGDTDPQRMKEELRARRGSDARRPTAGFGPHRDDLVFEIEGHAARAVASQGQHRAITLALKAAEFAAIRAATGLEPLQLLDDVSSELDPDRTAALFSFLATARGQVLLTTTRAQMVLEQLPATAERAVFHVSGGRLSTPEIQG